MSYRSLALAVTALTSMSATNAMSGDAPSVYVAPGGVYVGAGPVYVIPAPNNGYNGNGAGPHVAPSYYGYEYPPPALVPPAPAVVAPTTIYGPNGYYNGPNGYYYGRNGHYYGPKVRYYEPPPLSVYGAELPPPRPPLAVPHRANGYVNGRYDPRWQTPY
jgi:hypothetical protein